MQEAATGRAKSARPLSFGRVTRIFPHIVLITLVFTSVMPFVWMFFGSFKSYVELTSGKTLWPMQLDVRQLHRHLAESVISARAAE